MYERAVIAGHSHLSCFACRAFALEGVEVVATADGFPFDILKGPWPRDDAYWAKLRELSDQHEVMLSWQGNQHAQFLFTPEPNFDFVSSTLVSAPVDTGAFLVAERAVRELFEKSFAGLRVVIERLRASDHPCGITVLGTPPPKGDNDRLRANLHVEPYFAKLALSRNMELAGVALSNPLLRLKLWSLIQQMTREVAEALSCVFVPGPADAQDEQGFLRPEFWAGDITHANHAYGRLQLTQLAADAPSRLQRHKSHASL